MRNAVTCVTKHVRTWLQFRRSSLVETGLGLGARKSRKTAGDDCLLALQGFVGVLVMWSAMAEPKGTGKRSSNFARTQSQRLSVRSHFWTALGNSDSSSLLLADRSRLSMERLDARS